MFLRSSKIFSFWEIDKTNTNSDQVLIILQKLKGYTKSAEQLSRENVKIFFEYKNY